MTTESMPTWPGTCDRCKSRTWPISSDPDLKNEFEAKRRDPCAVNKRRRDREEEEKQAPRLRTFVLPPDPASHRKRARSPPPPAPPQGIDATEDAPVPTDAGEASVGGASGVLAATATEPSSAVAEPLAAATEISAACGGRDTGGIGCGSDRGLGVSTLEFLIQRRQRRRVRRCGLNTRKCGWTT